MKLSSLRPRASSTWATGALVFAALSFLAASCSRITSVSPECACVAPLNVTFAFEGGDYDELLSLTVTLDDVRLLGSSQSSYGDEGANVLDAPTAVEALSLDQRARNLETGFYAAGRYDRVRVVFSDLAPTARDLAGLPVPITLSGQRALTLTLDAPLVVSSDDVLSETVLLTVDPAASLLRDGVGGELVFEPVLRAQRLQSTEVLRMDSVRGQAIQTNPGDGLLILDGLDLLHAHTGIAVSVGIGPNTRFFDEDSLELANREVFLQSLLGPSKEVSAHGFFVPGVPSPLGPRMLATSLHIEGLHIEGLHDGSPQDRSSIVEGRIVGQGPGGALSLRVSELRGNEMLGVLLEQQPDPETLVFVPTPDALLVDEDGRPLDLTELAAGARFEVSFHAPFSAMAPFEASKVVLVEPAEHRGTFSTALGVPALFLRDGEPALEAGTVQSSATPIRIGAVGQPVVLDVAGQPSLVLADLQPPIRLVAIGELSGTAAEPELENATLIARPGRFTGIVSGANPAGGSFDAAVQAFHAPFGGQTQSPPLQVVLDPACTFDGRAASAEALFALFANLESGETLGVTVAGVASQNVNEVIAYEVRSRVQ